MQYIAWGEHPDDRRHQRLTQRGHYIDLSRWYQWAENRCPGGAESALAELESGTKSTIELLKDIDPDFNATLDATAEEIASNRLRALLQAWTNPTIPVLRTEVDSPLDVLEVFTRINLAGVQVAGTDVYLAAVKTFWPQAESRLEKVGQAAGGFLDRLDALRIVSRLASRGLHHADLLPLIVDRLAGPRGHPLILAMQELTNHDSRLIERIDRFSSWLRQNSQLRHGLRFVSGYLWDEVLAWAVTSNRPNENWYAENLEHVDAYLLGATLFRYPQVLGDRFRRVALNEAMVAGAEGSRFPLQRILEVARAEGFHRNRQRVRTLEDPADQQWTADWNAEILLCIAQRLPYQLKRPIDWDHIFPAAQSNRMWERSEYGRRMHHRHRRFVHSAGNFWALDASANRALQDMPPELKFAKLREWQVGGEGAHSVWPIDQWSLDDEDVRRFIEVDRGLNDEPKSIDDAMEIFHDLVTGRARRLLDNALSIFPSAKLFADDAAVGSSDPTPDAHVAFADALGLSPGMVAAARQADTPAKIAATETAPDLDLGSTWNGRLNLLHRVHEAVTRRLAEMVEPGRNVPPMQKHRHGIDFGRWVRLGSPTWDTLCLIGVVVQHAREGATPLWLQFHHAEAPFQIVRDRINTSPFADDAVEQAHERLWLPLKLDPERTEQELADDVVQQILAIRQAVADSDTPAATQPQDDTTRH